MDRLAKMGFVATKPVFEVSIDVKLKYRDLLENQNYTHSKSRYDTFQ